jgi:hypothetical protein
MICRLLVFGDTIRFNDSIAFDRLNGSAGGRVIVVVLLGRVMAQLRLRRVLVRLMRRMDRLWRFFFAFFGFFLLNFVVFLFVCMGECCDDNDDDADDHSEHDHTC